MYTRKIAMFASAIILLTGTPQVLAQTQQADQMRQVEMEMLEAEKQLAAAAQQIAELSSRQMPRIESFGRRIAVDARRPMLGVNIGSPADTGPVEGAEIVGVSPGGAADGAGLRAGDLIVAINGESMSGANSVEAADKLLDFMAGVEDGDTLDVDYMRGGNVTSISITPRPLLSRGYAFAGPVFDLRRQGVASPSGAMPHSITLFRADGGWGDMEMVSLTDRLGRYFGTDEGLLVVRAPEDAALQLEDGDVIQSIGGRVPNSVSHAMRILGSYQAGEQLDMVIMRDRKKLTLSIEMPDNRTGSLQNFTAPVRGQVLVQEQLAEPD